MSPEAVVSPDLSVADRLERHAASWSSRRVSILFQDDPGRFDRYSLELGGLFLDYSKNRITDETLALLYEWARDVRLEDARDRMFAGEKVNVTEGRAVLHTALRGDLDTPLSVGDEDVTASVAKSLRKMSAYVAAVHDGRIRGSMGLPIETVVNIGIGGSDLGPRLVVAALAPWQSPDMRVYFVSNVDAADIRDVLAQCQPETTLFIVASKTFTTEETLTNARSARAWLSDALGDAEIERHFAAVTANVPAALQFGLSPACVFAFNDWVGGRFSVWSSVGLSVALAVGFDRFQSFLDGAATMDSHFRTAPLEKNMPVILGLLGAWYIRYFRSTAYAILPYDQRLRLLPDWLQQLDMESNGKGVDVSGVVLSQSTGPVVFGQVGTNGQHSFYQLLHQGTHLIPCDFIGVATPRVALHDHHARLMSHFFAQTEALMRGQSEAEARADLVHRGYDPATADRLAPHRTFSGNRPTNSLLLRCLDPHTLGMLLALYEHKIFVQGRLFGINSFDQWGVELGKTLAARIFSEMQQGDPVSTHDGSTNGMMNRFRDWRVSS